MEIYCDSQYNIWTQLYIDSLKTHSTRLELLGLGKPSNICLLPGMGQGMPYQATKSGVFGLVLDQIDTCLQSKSTLQGGYPELLLRGVSC